MDSGISIGSESRSFCSERINYSFRLRLVWASIFWVCIIPLMQPSIGGRFFLRRMTFFRAYGQNLYLSVTIRCLGEFDVPSC